LSVFQLEEKNLNVEQMVHDEIVEGGGQTTCLYVYLIHLNNAIVLFDG
jgi:hypothetical protein